MNDSHPPADILMLVANYGGDDEELGQEQQQICGEYETYTLARFLFLTLSSVLSLFGLSANLALFVLFASQRSREPTSGGCPPTLYPRVLALLDACICAGYILLFGVDAAVIYLRLRPLFLLYHLYIVPAFTLSRIAQLAIPYMLIFATLERLVWIGSGKLRNPLLRRMYSVRGRQITVGVTLGTCVLLRLPTLWATTIHEYPQCADFFRSKTAGPADWVLESRLFYVYDFHLLSIAQTVFPFFVLLAFNLVVVRRVCKLSSSASGDFAPALLRLPPSNSPSTTSVQRHSSVSATRHGRYGLPRRSSFFIHRFTLSGPVRVAVYTMLCIVCSYLISNSLHLALTVLERSNSALLRHPEDPSLASTFHTLFSDVVSFVYMFTSAIRVLIYYACNPSIRAHIRDWLPCCRRRDTHQVPDGSNGGAVPKAEIARKVHGLEQSSRSADSDGDDEVIVL